MIEIAALMAAGGFFLVCAATVFAVLWRFGILHEILALVMPKKFPREAGLWQGPDGEALPYDKARQAWENTFSGRAPHASWSEIN